MRLRPMTGEGGTPWVRLKTLATELLVVAAFLALANLPFWLLAWRYVLPRPVINADAFVAIVAAMISPVLGIAALVLYWCLDQLQSQSLAFHFTSPLEFLRTVRFAGQIDWFDYLSLPLLAAALVLLLTLTLIWLLLRRWRPRPLAVLICFVVVTATDAYNGSALTQWIGRDSFRLAANISGSPSYNLLAIAWQTRSSAARPVRRWPEDGSPDIADWARRTKGNVLIVVVESMGEHRNQAVGHWLLGQLLDGTADQRWQLSVDTVPFDGSTTAGELRTLCGLSAHYSRLTADLAAECLPQKMQALGYETVGLHGFSGNMFDRYSWWPKLGLTKVAFSGDISESTPRCGGAFRGVCDTNMVDEAMRALRTPRRFVYLLTLNTHMPLLPVDLPVDLTTLCASEHLGDSVCQLTGQLGIVLARLRAGLGLLPDPPLVVIVGDHAPPFVVREDRDQYLPRAVPRFMLVPR